jgi:hypothetical protein
VLAPLHAKPCTTVIRVDRDEAVCRFEFGFGFGILANKEPWPSSMAATATWSTETYDKDVSAGSITSLTLEPFGEDRSVISRHLPGWCFFSITPKLLGPRYCLLLSPLRGSHQ